MTEENKAERNEQFFEEYRQKRAELADLRDKLKESEKATTAIRNRMMATDAEISTMRRIITSMIDEGYDPMQAKLIGVEEIHSNIWDQVIERNYRHSILDNHDNLTTGGMGGITAYPLNQVIGSSGSMLTSNIDKVWTSLKDVDINYGKFK